MGKEGYAVVAILPNATCFGMGLPIGVDDIPLGPLLVLPLLLVVSSKGEEHVLVHPTIDDSDPSTNEPINGLLSNRHQNCDDVDAPVSSKLQSFIIYR